MFEKFEDRIVVWFREASAEALGHQCLFRIRDTDFCSVYGNMRKCKFGIQTLPALTLAAFLVPTKSASSESGALPHIPKNFFSRYYLRKFAAEVLLAICRLQIVA